VHRDERVLGGGFRAETDDGAGPIAQFEVTGEEIGVQVGQEHMRDAEVALHGE